MFQQVLNLFTTGIEQAGQAILNLFTNIIAIFWVSGTGLTFYGVIFIIVLGTSILILMINFIAGLFGLGGDDDDG